MTIFFSFSIFWWNEDKRMAALFHFARIFKEPMTSRNLFGKPVMCIGTTSCLQTPKYKYPSL